MQTLNLEVLNQEWRDKNPEEILKEVFQLFNPKRVVLASSLSIEDQVLTHMILGADPLARIFFLDTGRHFPQTYKVLDTTMKQYNFHFEVYAPNQLELEGLVSEYGPNLFYESLELRKKCCEIRKVNPLNRVLATVDVWICGLRKEQSQGRQEVDLIEWDEAHGIYKINPLAYWSEEEVWRAIKKNNIPFNTLHNDGFPSIGCQPCTRAVKPGEDIRSGRWWWENPDHKECGLHR